MAIRKHRPGELVIEQTRDLTRVAALLERGGLMTEGIDWPPACYLGAFVGDELAGVVGIEPRLDAALIRSLYVAESMRKRGIGAQLFAAARKAAHTRGARHLYLFSTDAGAFFQRLGLSEVPVAELLDALSGTPQIEFYRARPDELAREVAWHLDISEDGVIRR
jgi:GNAT superfamily N-acetyltransferase